MKSSIAHKGIRAKNAVSHNGKKRNPKAKDPFGAWKDYPNLDKAIEELYKSRTYPSR